MPRNLFFWAALLCPLSLLAGIDWEPVTEADWKAGSAGEWKDANAIILLEKVVVDDRKVAENLCTTTIYRRIKILNPRGYGHADVSVPYLHKKVKIKGVKGRTLWANGRSFNLDKKQIFSTERLSTKKLAIKQKAFSLPGVQDGCIIEYIFTFESPSRIPVFNVQQELPVLHFELSWHFFNFEIPYGLVMAKSERKELESYLRTPFIRAYNLPVYQVLQPKSVENPDPSCLKFIAGPLPAFKDEPLAVNTFYTRAALVLFYNKRIGDYWQETFDELQKEMQKFAKKNNRFEEQYRLFAGSTGSTGYIQTVYEWIRFNIHNTDYDDATDKPKAKPVETLDDVLISRHAGSYDINRLFYFFLKRHGLRPELAFVSDRDERIVDNGIPDWQFDESCVLLPVRKDFYKAYMPGTRHLQAGTVPYNYEGTMAFAVDSLTFGWRAIPFSSATENSVKRFLELKIADDGAITGQFLEQSEGQVAWFRRTAASYKDSSEAISNLLEALQNLMPRAEIDSIRFHHADSLNQKMMLSCRVTFPPLLRGTGADYFLQPADYLGREGNQLVAPTRTAQILLDHSFDISEYIRLTPSDKWQVRAFPMATHFSHLSGEIQNVYANLGGDLNMQRHITLHVPYWKPTDYLQLQQFFKRLNLLNSELIVLQKKTL